MREYAAQCSDTFMTQFHVRVTSTVSYFVVLLTVLMFVFRLSENRKLHFVRALVIRLVFVCFANLINWKMQRSSWTRILSVNPRMGRHAHAITLIRSAIGQRSTAPPNYVLSAALHAGGSVEQAIQILESYADIISPRQGTYLCHYSLLLLSED
ncbi:unnamed protein product [Bemisia tabaci]|uniref:Uncharacterized protein n=1 Tax=Bemisia tabaci TaxID=7038 RepID=A0A9P0C6E8_BEMTA|nr:unnamed protein product [Bemisia tabaci]